MLLGPAKYDKNTTVRDRPDALVGTYGRATECAYPRHHVHQTDGPQISDRRLSTSCGVVDRPDHHCGDDLVSCHVHHAHVTNQNGIIQFWRPKFANGSQVKTVADRGIERSFVLFGIVCTVLKQLKLRT